MKDIKSILSLFEGIFNQKRIGPLVIFALNDTDFYVKKIGSGTINRLRIRSGRKVPDPTDPDLQHW
jgi:hypothetical protein